MESLIAKLRESTLHEEREQLMTNAAALCSAITCKELASLILQLNFADERLRALNVFVPKLSDPSNFANEVLEYLLMYNEKMAATAIFNKYFATNPIILSPPTSDSELDDGRSPTKKLELTSDTEYFDAVSHFDESASIYHSIIDSNTIISSSTEAEAKLDNNASSSTQQGEPQHTLSDKPTSSIPEPKASPAARKTTSLGTIPSIVEPIPQTIPRRHSISRVARISSLTDPCKSNDIAGDNKTLKWKAFLVDIASNPFKGKRMELIRNFFRDIQQISTTTTPSSTTSPQKAKKKVHKRKRSSSTPTKRITNCISVHQLCELLAQLTFSEERMLALKLFVEAGGLVAHLGNPKGCDERRKSLEEQILDHFPFPSSKPIAKDMLNP